LAGPRRDPLTGRDGRGVADHSHDVTMTARLGSQNAKAILDIMVRDALDEARQHFLGRRFRLRNHADRRICTAVARASNDISSLSVKRDSIDPLIPGGVESSLSSGRSALGLRTSVALISVTTVTPGTGSSITSTVRVSTAGLLGGFIDLLFFRATFFALTSLGLALAERFLGVGLATVRFTAFARGDFEALRVLPRAVDFPFRTVAGFFR
jgi:hypothetical protein